MKNDIRYRNTEEKIRTAFLSLIERNGFRDTSVREIISRAGINRATFYLHYTDKYALLESVENELFYGIISALTGINDISDVDVIEEMPFPPDREQLIRVTSFIESQKRTVMILCSGNVDPFLIDKYIARITPHVKKLMMPGMDPVQSEYVIAGAAGIISNLYRTWISRGFEENAKEYIGNVLPAITHIADLIKEIAI